VVVAEVSAVFSVVVLLPVQEAKATKYTKQAYAKVFIRDFLWQVLFILI
jgi:hypothetical protein